jgi:hypothetical protein
MNAQIHLDHHAPDPGLSSNPNGFWRSRAGLVAIGFLAIGAFFLVTEHTAHVLGVLPYLLLLACPLMHVFIHGGHGSHGGGQGTPRAGDSDTIPRKGT